LQFIDKQIERTALTSIPLYYFSILQKAQLDWKQRIFVRPF